ncbi:MAG: hypothetical protein A3A31_00335 [Candidatus Zambryskibacteria bacterium RIFCSPLOWO2_01_FULL_48_25]|uniref:Primosomal protein N' 3' DNA-binding domain-containing protein n=1 Tax=Candidatus Zambryskibacteria bacterium RIFCSPHIGHO2_01_FULL_46_25 TaxID=1802738 RepID=A0A1G2SY65_9BACT|nr:MAG: hypothetical protein A2838_01195 [Candidatus Zambryskibacteria bacterium RIFCSPHIGHO2_01_FULL_46_25]OHB06743.1 MAG: hypothetical protein A3A31_00335 [Candidatus Zambryskibacteria bacterium RIFCSPLOWO2_01_FULL_48_25]
MKDGKPATKTYLVEVIPITRGRGESLSYFSTEKLLPGTIVRAPLRKGYANAVVTSSRSTIDAKAEIRKAGYPLRKIAQRDVCEAGFSGEFLNATRNIALYYAVSVGTMLASILPKILLENPEKFFLAPPRKKAHPSAKETILLQMEVEERYGQYRATVRQCFARKKSAMVIVPTHHDALKAVAQLSTGIEPYVYAFTLKGKTKEMERVWQKALREQHPVLFVTTPAGVAFDRPDLDTIIMERENSRSYRSLLRPYIHLKVFLEKLCKEAGKQLVLGDSVLSIETLWREKNGEYGELSLVRWRLPASPATLVDASAKPDDNGKFEIFSPELKTLIRKALDEKTGILLFGARKGLAPTTVCGDCGYILPCLNCGAPVVLHDKRSDRIFICHACGTKRDSATTCGYCGSWKLVPLGIGIERIATEARQIFHTTPVEILDKDYAPSDGKARSIAKKFSEQGGILVGTELAFYHLEKVPYSALVSADSLFSIPDFGINERIFYIVSRLREMTLKESVIQTRNIGKQVLAWATQGNIIDFYLSEIAERKELLYPPFSIFIKISPFSPGSNHGISKAQDKLLKWHPENYKDSIIIRVTRERWPDEELSGILSLLGREFNIKVDPESII